MDHPEPLEPTNERDTLDRRSLIKVATAGVIAGGMLAASPSISGTIAEAFVPNNFRAAIHVTNEEGFQYAYSALETISKHYKDATGRLIIDGSATKALASQDTLDNLKSVDDHGAEIVAASDALEMNGIDPKTLPDFIDTDNPGVIAVIDAQIKGYHYYKL